MALKIGFICPTYDAIRLHSYTELALASFFETTPKGVAIVVDDGSRQWSGRYEQLLYEIAKKHSGELHVYRFDKAQGLTRSWNKGLTIADELNLDYAVAGNNDVVFTNKWHQGLLHALSNGYDMVGPLSNAPGVTAKGKQEIQNYVDNYRLTDSIDYLNQLADKVYEDNLGKVVDSAVNGFFQMCSMVGWRSNMYSDQLYYKPFNTHTSKGFTNKTPFMTLNEDEWQARARQKSMSTAVVLSSFIFHYRAVSRGNSYKRGQWYRQA